MAKIATDEEGIGPLERGRGRYQQKDYPGALSAFTEAVNISSGHLLLTALDYRAAAHEKLQQLQPALLDAKRMIDLMPNLSKGYLRCGKVLQLKGKPELALKIYERGLNKVKIGNDDERTALQRMFNKAKRALDPEKVLDPLVFLPIELAEMVCHYLSMRDRVVCLAVSKPWKRLLESSTKLWVTLDTRSVKKSMTHRSLKAHLKRSKYTLDLAIISLRAALDLQKMSYITNNCKNLQRLEIHGSGLIGDSLTKSLPLAKSLKALYVSRGCAMTFSAVQESLKACRSTITEATFLEVTGVMFPDQDLQLDHLKKLTLKTWRENRPISLEMLAKATPNLESAIFNNWMWTDQRLDLSSMWPCLQYLDLSNMELSRLPNFPVTLKHLLVGNNRDLEDNSVDDQSIVLPLLETFACARTSLTNTFIKSVTQESIKKGNLKSLSIGDRIFEPEDLTLPVEDAYPVSGTVEELSLALLMLSDREVIKIVNCYPNIKKLDVSGTSITGVAVKAFVQLGVKRLKVNECSDIGPDAVEWARGQGIEVEFNFPSRSGNLKGYRDAAFAGAF